MDGRKKAISLVLALVVVATPLLASSSGPEIQRRIFIHFSKPNSPARAQQGGGYYKLLGAKWWAFPVPLEVNPGGLDEGFVLASIGMAAGEWDDGDYSYWGGVAVGLFAPVTTTGKGYGDLAWDSGRLDGANSIVWGNYPTSGVIAVAIVWYNTRTKTIIEFDIVFDTDYAWGDASSQQNVMDLQNIATHELGHGAGMDDVYQSVAWQETMYGYSAYGETGKRDLFDGDKRGITKLYG